MITNSQENVFFNKYTLVIYRTILLFSILESLAVITIILNRSMEGIRQFFNSSVFYFVFALLFILILFLAFLFIESFVRRTIIIKINHKVSQAADKSFFGIFLISIILIGLLIELFILFPTTEDYQVIAGVEHPVFRQ